MAGGSALWFDLFVAMVEHLVSFLFFSFLFFYPFSFVLLRAFLGLGIGLDGSVFEWFAD